MFLLQDIEEKEQKHCQFKMPPCRDHDHDDDFADNNDDHVLCLFLRVFKFMHVIIIFLYVFFLHYSHIYYMIIKIRV